MDDSGIVLRDGLKHIMHIFYIDSVFHLFIFMMFDYETFLQEPYFASKYFDPIGLLSLIKVSLTLHIITVPKTPNVKYTNSNYFLRNKS